jgi:hypothetical protein
MQLALWSETTPKNTKQQHNKNRNNTSMMPSQHLLSTQYCTCLNVHSYNSYSLAEDATPPQATSFLWMKTYKEDWIRSRVLHKYCLVSLAKYCPQVLRLKCPDQKQC